MRSRYCAYVIGEREYLSATWHPDFRPLELDIDPQIRWLGLEIIDSSDGDLQAMVEFEARLLVNGKVEAIHEKSAFKREHGKWLYTNGEILAPRFESWKPGRNESCPCASGKKFKRCCG